MEYLNLNEMIIEDINSKELDKVRDFLKHQDLRFDENVEYTVAIYNEEKIVGTGSFDGKILKCIAVDDNYKGMGISNKIVSDLISEQYRRGSTQLFVYTKPKNQLIFKELSFYKIAEVPDKVILLENNSFGISEFVEEIRKKKVNGNIISSVVVNCNPFTLGHKYLIDKASKESDVVHVFVVSEDRSIFPAEVRYKMVKEGISHLNNIVLHKGGDYIISNATFPSYFIKKADDAVKSHTLLDIEIFKKYVVPALGINRRYIGEEPMCQVTKTYNDTMKEMLPCCGVDVIEVPRVVLGGDVTSASRVRELIKEEKFAGVKKLVPEIIYKFLISTEAKEIINKI
ncbi:[citrate (pro-3S)-lyase] ligase [Clostridium sp. SHJSY1]|uniref:[citrate (pro-3S)-lyase] ligase n=1 Tax=Clostridium sp. SHJSY1 TaxID=2942483 RepID=UPI0028755A4B|nr:[citrate (pro-3S)-lyase] ligase [Clostridium sp. SHJSY1]MDS0526492.1 [citrate (pro-3S)-lyase] ligase [Clostridium sp. SHJSY1]